VSVVVLGIDDCAFVGAFPGMSLAIVVWSIIWDRGRVGGISSHLEKLLFVFVAEFFWLLVR
jgi:hypothetical protein